MRPRDRILMEVSNERDKQIEKWGVRDLHPFIHMSVLVEEVGEASQAILKSTFGGKSWSDYRKELVQIAAVAVDMIETMDREQVDLDSVNLRTAKTPKACAAERGHSSPVGVPGEVSTSGRPDVQGILATWYMNYSRGQLVRIELPSEGSVTLPSPYEKFLVTVQPEHGDQRSPDVARVDGGVWFKSGTQAPAVLLVLLQELPS